MGILTIMAKTVFMPRMLSITDAYRVERGARLESSSSDYRWGDHEMTAVQKITKRGDSAYMLIPAAVLRVLGFGPGDQVQIVAERNKMVVRAIDVVPRISESNKKFADKFYAEHEAAFKELAE